MSYFTLSSFESSQRFSHIKWEILFYWNIFILCVSQPFGMFKYEVHFGVFRNWSKLFYDIKSEMYAKIMK